MMEPLFRLLRNGFFTLNMLPLILLFSRRLLKRKKFGIRVLGGCIICIGSMLAISACGMVGHHFYSYVIQFAMLSVFCYFICDISFTEALYCTGIAYAVQHISYCLYQILFHPAQGIPISFLHLLPYAACLVGVSVLIYWTIGRALSENGTYGMDVQFSLISMGIILFLVLGLSMVSDYLYEKNHDPLYYVCMMYDLICCVFVLWEQGEYKRKLKQQREHDMDIWLQLKQKELYKLRRDDIERINLLCHDMKKHLESLKLFATEDERAEYYNRVSDTIASYDAQFDTGNQVLDILLAQKKLLCMKNHVELTCVADGRKLGFFHSVDLYTILGNTLDNAMESVLLASDPDKKLISVSIWTKGQILLMQIENYFDNPELRFLNGLPVTAKKAEEGHGYGLKSVKKAVEKYQGSMDIDAVNQIFRVTIMIPIPKEK